MSKKKETAPEVSEDLKPKASAKPAKAALTTEGAKPAAKVAAAPKAEAPKVDATKEVVSAKANIARVKVTQIGSSIGRSSDQGRTLIGLGLGKLNRSRVLESTPSVHGMINKVKHLVKVEAA